MDSGRLNQRVEIQQKQPQRGTAGSQFDNWQPLFSRWMAADPIGSREQTRLQAAQIDATVRFTCRYVPQLTESMRLVWQGRPYSITQLVDIGAEQRFQEILASADKSARNA